VRELIELGLGDKLAEIGIATEEFVYANRFGQVIWREPRGLKAGYHWPQVQRPSRQAAGDAGRKRRPGWCGAGWQPGRRLLGFEQDAIGVTARCDGSAARVTCW
jgi:hypothetical protein